MIFVGGGAQAVSAQVKQLAELLQAPVVAYRTGQGVLDSRHPLSLKQPEAHAHYRNDRLRPGDRQLHARPAPALGLATAT